MLGDSRSRAPFVLSPLCVFLMGISVKRMECNHIVVLKGSLMIENMSIYYFPRDREKKYKASMDEEDNARALYNVFPTKDFKVIFV